MARQYITDPYNTKNDTFFSSAGGGKQLFYNHLLLCFLLLLLFSIMRISILAHSYGYISDSMAQIMSRVTPLWIHFTFAVLTEVLWSFTMFTTEEELGWVRLLYSHALTWICAREPHSYIQQYYSCTCRFAASLIFSMF